MKIAVIGSGAIGGLAGGYLNNSGEDVYLVGRKDSVCAITKSGLTITGIRGNFNIPINISQNLERQVDLVILAVKTQDIEEVIKENSKYLEGTIILTTQNGVRADLIIAQHFGEKNIISSIVMFGSTYLEPGKIVHNFEGKWILGKPYAAKNDDKLKEIGGVLGKAFPVVISEDIFAMKWLKIFVNANNCLSAIIGKSMQETFSSLELCKISMLIWREGLNIVRKAAIELVSLPDFPLERLVKLTGMPLDESAKIFSGIMTNLSKEPLYGSILQSIKRSRSSEIDYINGEFVALAKSYGASAELNQRLVELVKKVERDKRFLTEEELISNTKELKV